jgi:Cys-tRNA(Pro)/Cys-tRNA(Cys) deacylase
MVVRVLRDTDAAYSAAMTPAIRALEAAKVPFSVHEYDRGDELRDFGREAAEALGLDDDRVFKTLIVTADGSELVAVVPVSGQLSLKAVGAVLGAKRVEMCDRDRAQRLTGYVIGGISPFGQKRKLPMIVDETCELFDTVYVSGGKRGVDVEVTPADLVALTAATVAAISV